MSPRDGQAEPAADHIAQEIQQNIVEVPVVEAQLFQQLEPVDDAPPTAAAADLGPAQLHGEDAAALEADITDLDLFARQFFGRRGFDDRRASLAAEQQGRGVRFRIATDQQHAFALLGHHVAQVRQRERFADPALAIDRDDLRVLGHLGVQWHVWLDRGLGAQPGEAIVGDDGGV